MARKSVSRGIRRVPGADDPYAGKGARLADELPSGDERLQDDVAQLRADVQQIPHRIVRDGINCSGGPRDAGDDRRPAGQVRHVPGEFASLVQPHQARRVAGQVQDLDRARLDDEHGKIALADAEERLAGREVVFGRTRAVSDIRDLRAGELGKGNSIQI